MQCNHGIMAVTKPRAINDRRIAYRLVGLQAATALLLPVLVWMIAGRSAAQAAFVGGGIATVANLYFAVQAFRFSGARASREMVRAFYRGEAGKFVIVMVLFVAAFRLLDGIREMALYLFLGFFLVYGLAWVAPLLPERHR